MDKQENNSNNNEQMNVYGLYLQKYFRDLQRLQLQHGRLWQSYRELQIKSKSSNPPPHHHHHSDESNDTNNKTVDEWRQELEQEKLQNKSLNAEMLQLVDRLKTFETRHKELLNILNKENKQGNVFDNKY